MKWIYDAGEHRIKHCWSRPEAGFESGDGRVIGKCSSNIDHLTAEQLLNDGIVIEGSADQPEKIVNVYEGVIYVAVPTIPGKSFHGYPWKSLPGRSRIARKVFEELKRRAVESGHDRQFRQWVKDHGQ